MLRINPEEVSQDIMKIGTIGLSKLLNFEDKKYRRNGMTSSVIYNVGDFGGIFHKKDENYQNCPNPQDNNTEREFYYTINFSNPVVSQFRNMRLDKILTDEGQINIRARYINEVLHHSIDIP